MYTAQIKVGSLRSYLKRARKRYLESLAIVFHSRRMVSPATVSNHRPSQDLQTSHKRSIFFSILQQHFAIPEELRPNKKTENDFGSLASSRPIPPQRSTSGGCVSIIWSSLLAQSTTSSMMWSKNSASVCETIVWSSLPLFSWLEMLSLFLSALLGPAYLVSNLNASIKIAYEFISS